MYNAHWQIRKDYRLYIFFSGNREARNLETSVAEEDLALGWHGHGPREKQL